MLHVGIAGATRASGIAVPELVLGSEAVFCDLAQPFRLRAAAGRRRSGAPGRSAPGVPRRPGAADRHQRPRRRHRRRATSRRWRASASSAPPQLAGVPALEVRAVSNEIEEPDRGRWRFDDALAALAAAAPRLLEEIAAACV